MLKLREMVVYLTASVSGIKLRFVPSSDRNVD